METTIILWPFAVLLVAAGLAVAVVLVVILAIVGACRSGGGDRKARVAETRLIQEMHEGMMDLTKRVESLETLLLEHSRGKTEEARHDQS